MDVSHDQRRLVFDRSGPCYIRGTVVHYYLPFSGYPELLRAQPDEFDFNPPHGSIEGNELTFSYEVAGTNVGETKPQYEQDLAGVRQYITRVNAMVESYNAALPGLIQQHLSARRGRLVERQKGLEKLGLPVRSS